MNFLSPQWLILFPVLLALGYLFFRENLFRPLRLIILTLLIIALADPIRQMTSKGLDLWVLVDHSESAQPYVAPHQKEWEELLEKNRGPNDRLFFIDYAGEVLRRSDNVDSTLSNYGSSLTGEAIFKAASLAESDRASRILVMSDGYSTDSLTGLSAKLKKQSVPLDYRLVHFLKEGDVRVERLKLPARVLPGEKFLVEAIISGPENVNFDYQLLRDGQEIDSGELQIKQGTSLLRRSDSIRSGGHHRYEFLINYKDDSVPGNNRAESLVEVQGGPRVLLLSAYESDPFSEVLKAQGFEVQHFTKFKELESSALTGTRFVILNNVPAWEFPDQFLSDLNFYVRYQGGGLLMCGGEFSFGVGGYYKSPIDELLPLSMELKNEHRKLRTAMAIVMDRSGSMSMTVEGGKTKMSLANEGTAQTVNLLGASDSVAVIAVDSSAHVFVPMTQVGDGGSIKSRARKVVSMGGGIYVYTGLKAAWKELRKSEGQRHIILFTDAADSEEPGDYKNLISKMRKAGATISVIALGTEKDADAEFLKDIAKRGEGRIFFTNKPESLPAIFAQETVSVTRSAFIKDPVKTTANENWLKISNGGFKWPDQIDGYNLSYLRDKAQTTLLSKDEYKAPLVAWWKKDAGRVSAISFPVSGDYSELVRKWSGYGDFLQTITRWTAAPEVPSGLGLRTKMEGNSLALNLHFNGQWNETFSKSIPKIFIRSSSSDLVREGAWRRLAPGLYNTSLNLRSGESINGVIQAGDYTIPFGPLQAGIDMEWVFDRERIQDLQTVSQLSGGEERSDLSQAWQRPEKKLYRDLSIWFLITALLLFLWELYSYRVGFAKRAQIADGSSYAEELLKGLDFDAGKAKESKPEEIQLQEDPELNTTDNRDKRRDRYRRAKLGGNKEG